MLHVLGLSCTLAVIIYLYSFIKKKGSYKSLLIFLALYIIRPISDISYLSETAAVFG